MGVGGGGAQDLGDVGGPREAAHVADDNPAELKGGMDALFELITMLAFHWRIGIAVLFALISAVFLATNLSWFTGWYGVLLVIFSFGAGLIWESAPRSHKEGGDE